MIIHRIHTSAKNPSNWCLDSDPLVWSPQLTVGDKLARTMNGIIDIIIPLFFRIYNSLLVL